MKQYFLLCLVCLCTMSLSAQSTRKIKELENQRNELQQQIAESETLLRSTKKDVKSQLDNLALLNGQIEDRKKYIRVIERDVQSLNGEIATLQRQLKGLQRELKDKKDKYEASVQYMYRNKSVQEKLMFIFSAENLSQTYRRLRYVQEYANYQRLQAVEIERKQKQVEAKKAELETTRSAKQKLLKEGEAEKKKLEKQEKEKQTLLNGLKRKQKGIQTEINKKRKSAQKLNAEIDRLIEIEIEKARKRAEEEARRKAKEEAAKAGIIVVLRLWNKGHDDGRNEGTEAFFRSRLPGDWQENNRGYRIREKLYLEYGDRFAWPDKEAPDGGDRVFCYGLRDQFGILCDGTVVPCCLDSEGVINLGNIYEEDIVDILNSPRAKAMVKGFGDRKATEDLCRRCGYARRFG